MTPVVPLAAVTALVVALVAPVTPPWFGLGCVLAAGACLVVGARCSHPTPLVLVAVVLVVLGATGVRLHRMADGPLHAAAAAARAVDVTVEVVGEPDELAEGRWRADVRVVTVDGTASGRRAELHTAAPLRFGATATGTAEARPVTNAWQRHRHVVARLTRADLTEVAGPGPVAAGTTRVRVGLAAVASATLSPGRAGLATGLVTGDTGLLPDGDAAAMRATGLTHLTAVSGSNVAMVVAGAWLVAGAVGLGARGRRRVALVTLALFAVLTRADPSVLRASTMAVLALAAGARGRRTRPLQLLAAAVLVLVLLDPLLGRRLGLLLSAAATLGVLVVAPRVRERLAAVVVLGRAGRLLDLLAVTIGAQVAVLPVLLVAGDGVSLATLPANLVAVPAAALASVLCTAAAVVALPLPGLAGGLLVLAGPALGVVLGAARRLQWWGPVVGVAEPIVLVGVLAAIAWLLVHRGRRIAGLVAVLCLVLPVLPSPSASDGFVLTAIDVGQGDAFLLTTDHASVLVDTGRDGRAARWLRADGPAVLDLLVLTHADGDHTGGAPDVLAAVEVGTVWQRPRGDELPPPALADALAAAAAHDVPVHAPVAGQQAVVGDLTVRVLAPTGPRVHLGRDGVENESSLVLRVDGPGGSVLLTGDIGPAAHAALLADPATRALLDVDVLTVPHHGSRHVDASLHEVATAADAVVSVGGDNRYGHPAPDVVAAVAASGARLHRTDRDGTVRIEVARAGGRVAADAGLHAGDLRRPVAAATGDRPRAARRAGRRGRRAHRRRRGGAAGRPHHLAVRWGHRPRAAVRSCAERRRAGRGEGARCIAGGHPGRGGGRARFGEPAQDPP